MKKNLLTLGVVTLLVTMSLMSCNETAKRTEMPTEPMVETEKPEYFLLRPEVEKAYGYSHAVKIGSDIKISGAVSMDNEGNPTAIGDLQQQMKNCYADLDKVLKHYGCTFDDVVVENIFTTNMPKFLEVSTYRNEIYTKQFPTGSWLGVKELALPEFMIEIELEVHKAK
ncbi:RidA family protein [Yeosuana sp.]|uniref:RidA family protein n=1 Tax=Yeosuana sp. TaxID=2529388 RepID=UPI00405526F8